MPENEKVEFTRDLLVMILLYDKGGLILRSYNVIKVEAFFGLEGLRIEKGRNVYKKMHVKWSAIG